MAPPAGGTGAGAATAGTPGKGAATPGTGARGLIRNGDTVVVAAKQMGLN